MENKIQVLDIYMKSLDARLFVEEDECIKTIDLCFTDYEQDSNFILAYIDKGKIKYPDIGMASEDLFNELSQYNDNFFKKYNELFNK